MSKKPPAQPGDNYFEKERKNEKNKVFIKKWKKTYGNQTFCIFAKKIILQYDYIIIYKGDNVMFKKVLVHARRGVKLIILFMIAIFLIIGAVAFLYKPTYSVYINGQQVGYSK